VRLVPPVTVDQVLGLVKYVASLGGRVDSSKLDELLDVDMNLLPHAVEAAVVLGLLRREGGDLVVTEEGRRSVELRGKRLRALIKELSDDVEPFKEIFNSIKDDSIGREVLRDIIRRAGYIDVDRAVEVFTEWLAYMGIEVTE